MLLTTKIPRAFCVKTLIHTVRELQTNIVLRVHVIHNLCLALYILLRNTKVFYFSPSLTLAFLIGNAKVKLQGKSTSAFLSIFTEKCQGIPPLQFYLIISQWIVQVLNEREGYLSISRQFGWEVPSVRQGVHITSVFLCKKTESVAFYQHLGFLVLTKEGGQ